MKIRAILFVNRWLICELINALLRPMFCRWRAAERDGRAHERYESLFFRLLDRCDCYPFCVEVDHCGLWILDEPTPYFGEEYST
jgi:hypothetical protein